MLTIAEIAKEIIRLAKEQKATIGTIESITGGRVVAAMTGVPGASSVVKGAIVTYTDEIKAKLADVPPDILEQEGAVSPECAEAMSKGGSLALNATYTLSVTGFAGPAGPADNHPVGTVYYGLSRLEGSMAVLEAHLAGERAAIQDEATRLALLFLLAKLENRSVFEAFSEEFSYPLREIIL